MSVNKPYQIRKDTKSGALKITESEIKLRSLTLGILSTDEAKFLNGLGSDIYILSLYNDGFFGRQKIATHRLFKAVGVRASLLPTHKVCTAFNGSVIEPFFNVRWPTIPDELALTPNSSNTVTVGKMGETAFYMDECNAMMLINYCFDRIDDRVDRSEKYTYNDFLCYMQGVGKDVRKQMTDERLLTYGFERGK